MATLNTNLLVINGDLLFNKEAILGLENTPTSKVVVDNSQQITSDKVGVIAVENYSSIFTYDIVNKWAQIVYFTGKELKLAKKALFKENSINWLPYELLNYVLSENGKLEVCENKQAIFKEINTTNDIDPARLVYNEISMQS